MFDDRYRRRTSSLYKLKLLVILRKNWPKAFDGKLNGTALKINHPVSQSILQYFDTSILWMCGAATVRCLDKFNIDTIWPSSSWVYISLVIGVCGHWGERHRVVAPAGPSWWWAATRSRSRTCRAATSAGWSASTSSSWRRARSRRTSRRTTWRWWSSASAPWCASPSSARTPPTCRSWSRAWSASASRTRWCRWGRDRPPPRCILQCTIEESGEHIIVWALCWLLSLSCSVPSRSPGSTSSCVPCADCYLCLAVYHRGVRGAHHRVSLVLTCLCLAVYHRGVRGAHHRRSWWAASGDLPEGPGGGPRVHPDQSVDAGRLVPRDGQRGVELHLPLEVAQQAQPPVHAGRPAARRSGRRHRRRESSRAIRVMLLPAVTTSTTNDDLCGCPEMAKKIIVNLWLFENLLQFQQWKNMSTAAMRGAGGHSILVVLHAGGRRVGGRSSQH